MTIVSKGQWGGDVTQYCAELAFEAGTQAEAQQLATINRLLADPKTRADRLAKLVAEAVNIANGIR